MSIAELEEVACPFGCADGDEFVVRGRDRLSNLPGEFDVVRCRQCGLMRTNPRPTPATIGVYYPDDYGPYQQTLVARAAPAASKVRGRLGRLLDPRHHPLPSMVPGRMLEIGCGSGRFLHEMAGSGWHVSGIEFSPSAAAAARELGFEVHTGALEDAPDPPGAVDLVVGWMVLEHLHDPLAALRKLRRWSSDTGWLVLSVPDASAWDRRLFGDAWYALSLPLHLYHYTPATLRRALNASGWQVERVIYQRNPDNAVRSLAYRARERGWASAADVLEEVGAGRRLRRTRALLGWLLGALGASGRMTVWARPLPGAPGP